MTGVSLTIQGTRTTLIFTNIILTLQMVEILIFWMGILTEKAFCGYFRAIGRYEVVDNDGTCMPAFINSTSGGFDYYSTNIQSHLPVKDLPIPPVIKGKFTSLKY